MGVDYTPPERYTTLPKTIQSDANMVWQIQIVNCSKNAGNHWILVAFKKMSETQTVCCMMDPLGKSRYSDPVHKILMQAGFKTWVACEMVQHDSWRCGYFCALWKVVFQRQIEANSFDPLVAALPPLPQSFPTVCWRLLSFRDEVLDPTSLDLRSLDVSDPNKDLLPDVNTAIAAHLPFTTSERPMAARRSRQPAPTAESITLSSDAEDDLESPSSKRKKSSGPKSPLSPAPKRKSSSRSKKSPQ